MAIALAEPSVSSSSINMGQSVTITHESPALTGIKRYTITWSFAGQSGTLATQTADTSTTWTPALATFAAYIPNAVSGVATITCATYDLSESSSTPVGSKSCTLTLLVPSSVVPTASSVSASEGNTSLPSAFSGVYVKGYSKFKLALTAQGLYGATVKSISMSTDGRTYTSTYSASSVTAALTSNTLTQAGSGKSVSYTVTDSRGRTVSGTVGSLTVADYSVPQITNFRARRSNGSTASSTGTNAQRYVAASVTAVGTNSITSAVLSWKQKNASVWATSDKVTIASSGTAIPSSGSAAWAVIAKSGSNVTFDGLYSYDFKLEVTDKAGNTTTSYTTISTVSVMLDFNNTGNGLGIGMINQNTNSIDSAWTYRGTGMNLTGTIDTQITSWDNATAPSAERSYDTYYVTDCNDRTMVLERIHHDTDNTIGVEYGVRRQISDSSVLWNTLRLSVTANGTRTVAVHDAAAWRTALGLGSMATQESSSYLPISGGTLTGELKVNSEINRRGSGYIFFAKATDTSDKFRAGLAITSANQLYFRSAKTTGATYHDVFYLPAPENASTSQDVTYNILTTKAAVTVPQGGTGATSVSAARTNLGVPYKQSFQIAGSSSTTVTFPGNAALIFGKRGDVGIVAMVDYWSSGSALIYCPTSTISPFITKAEGSRVVTIENNYTAAFAGMIISYD